MVFFASFKIVPFSESFVILKELSKIKTDVVLAAEEPGRLMDLIVGRAKANTKKITINVRIIRSNSCLSLSLRILVC